MSVQRHIAAHGGGYVRVPRRRAFLARNRPRWVWILVGIIIGAALAVATQAIGRLM